MTMIWSDDYRTGDETVDRQHQRLFDAINRLGGLIAMGIGGGPEVDGLIEFLGTYLQTHFAYEEACMARHKCPMAAQNKRAHDMFVSFYEDFIGQCAQEGLSLDLLRRLHWTAESWLVNHICKIDVHLRVCAQRKAA